MVYYLLFCLIIILMIYLKDLLAKDYGCHVGSVFFGCFIYADDIIILSPTLCGLQEMLNVCTWYSRSHDIVFNSKKSVYTTVGKKYIM